MKSIQYLFFRLPEKIRFILAGIINTAVGLSLFSGLYYFLNQWLNYQVILALSFSCGTFIGFLNFKYLVFRTQGAFLYQFSKTFVSYIFVYIFNALLLSFFVEILKLHPYMAQGVCVLITPFVSYCLHKYFSFRQKEMVKDAEKALF